MNSTDCLRVGPRVRNNEDAPSGSIYRLEGAKDAIRNACVDRAVGQPDSPSGLFDECISDDISSSSAEDQHVIGSDRTNLVS